MKQSAMPPRTGRIIELDIAKGLGILSVILYNALPASPLQYPVLLYARCGAALLVASFSLSPCGI